MKYLILIEENESSEGRPNTPKDKSLDFMKTKKIKFDRLNYKWFITVFIMMVFSVLKVSNNKQTECSLVSNNVKITPCILQIYY